MKRHILLAAAVFPIATSASPSTELGEKKTITQSQLNAICEAAPDTAAKIHLECKAASRAGKAKRVTSAPQPSNPPPPSTAAAGNGTPPANKTGSGLPSLSAGLADQLGCTPIDGTLFVRSDAIDNFNYLLFLPSGASASAFNTSLTMHPPSGGPSSPAATASPTDGNSQSTGQSPNAAAKGLSISFTDNYQAKTQATAIDGRISYLIVGEKQCDRYVDTRGPFIAGFGFAPFVGSAGSWNEPTTTVTTSSVASGKKPPSAGTTTTTSSNGITTTTVVPTKTGSVTTITKKYSQSALTFGADFQVFASTANLPIKQNFFYISPYYQTDYLGAAQIGAINFAWEPIADYLLNDGQIFQDYSYYIAFRANADFTQVSNPGLSLLEKGQHAWIGETLRPSLALFPTIDAPSSEDNWIKNWLRGRITLIGTQEYYWDAATGAAARYYQAILQYKLGQCKNYGSATGQSCSIAGSSSISLEYDWGKDINTMVKQNQWKVTLNYSY
jgi:hypothetical protein